MLDNSKRFGKLTSSNNGILLKKGRGAGLSAPALEYISKVKKEIAFGRSLNTTRSAKPLNWGSLCEVRVFQKLGTSYVDWHNDTIQHPSIECWAGTPDAFKNRDGGVCVEIKCPFTLESFYDLVQSFEDGGIEEVRAKHSEGDKYYWQCVSNAILLGVRKAELIVYCPYKSELSDIKLEAESYPFAWISFAQDEDLPYLLDDGKFKNLNIMPFDIPESDVELLTSTILHAQELLR